MAITTLWHGLLCSVTPYNIPSSLHEFPVPFVTEVCGVVRAIATLWKWQLLFSITSDDVQSSSHKFSIPFFVEVRVVNGVVLRVAGVLIVWKIGFPRPLPPPEPEGGPEYGHII